MHVWYPMRRFLRYFTLKLTKLLCIIYGRVIGSHQPLIRSELRQHLCVAFLEKLQPASKIDQSNHRNIFASRLVGLCNKKCHAFCEVDFQSVKIFFNKMGCLFSRIFRKSPQHETLEEERPKVYSWYANFMRVFRSQFLFNSITNFDA